MKCNANGLFANAYLLGPEMATPNGPGKARSLGLDMAIPLGPDEATQKSIIKARLPPVSLTINENSEDLPLGPDEAIPLDSVKVDADGPYDTIPLGNNLTRISSAAVTTSPLTRKYQTQCNKALMHDDGLSGGGVTAEITCSIPGSAAPPDATHAVLKLRAACGHVEDPFHHNFSEISSSKVKDTGYKYYMILFMD